MDTSLALPPIYHADLFAPAALRAPFEHYRALRDLGPVVRLADPTLYVLARFNDVRDALRAPDVLVSGQGVGFSPQFNSPGGPNLIQSDGDRHARMKKEVVRPLGIGELRKHRSFLKELIGRRIASLVDAGPFDAMSSIASVLPTEAISALVGLPEEGRASMLDWAAAAFNALGPPKDAFASDFELLREAFVYIRNQSRDTVRPGSWAHALFDAVDGGRLDEAEARGAISAYVVPSLDTTILAKGHLLHLLSQNPDQWQLLRDDPARIPDAVTESLRHSSVIRWFSRVAAADYAAGDVFIPKDARVMLVYPSANRDERRFEAPERFDVGRDARAHLAFGNGQHMCGGMHLARMEMEVMLEALVEQCATIETGAPDISANRGLYGFSRLPCTLHSLSHEERSHAAA